MPDYQPLLGRHVQHDPRSRSFAVEPVPAPTELRSVSWHRSAPVFDQGSQGPGGTGLGSCTANAGLGAIGTSGLLAKARRGVTEDLVVPFYSEVTAADEFPGTYPPDDTGSSGLAVAKVLLTRGWISSYTHAFSLLAALTALQDGPVIVGTNWYGGMFDPDAHGMLNISGTVAGGHEYEVLGCNVRSQTVRMVNSWGRSWGQGGRATMTWSTFGQLLSEDGDCTRLVR